MVKHLEGCIRTQKRAMSFGKRPFGASLVGPDGEVLLTHQSIDVVNHAEATLARLAVTHFSLPYLWTCTLYTTWEPCAMCTYTIYWANIGRIVFGASNDTLMALTGADNPQNLGIDLSTRQALEKGKKPIEVFGPFDGTGEGKESYAEGGLEKVVADLSKPYF